MLRYLEYTLLFFVAALVVFYSYLFFIDLSPFWFNPRWSSDDAQQQVFPFLEILYPERFSGDYVFQAMKEYLAPLHYWLGSLITLLTKDIIMTSHWMMLVQFLLTVIFLIALVWTLTHKKLPSYVAMIPVILSLLWFLHSRMVYQRLTAGLQRGWALPLIAAYFYLSIAKKNKWAIFVIFLSTLLNPIVSPLLAIVHALALFKECLEQKKILTPSFIHSLIAAPIILVSVLYSTIKSPEIGKMAKLEQAQHQPEFSREGGRFSFLPFPPISEELPSYALRVFIGKIANPSKEALTCIPWIVTCFTIFIFIYGAIKREVSLPFQIWMLPVVALVLYFLARKYAFLLHVPDRHLLIPLALFFIAAFPPAIWNIAFSLPRYRLPCAIFFTLAIGATTWWGLGDGLQNTKKGVANFNIKNTQWGKIYPWIKNNLAKDAYIAGEPIYLNPIQLFGERRGYATSETWHPFFDKYNQEMKRRIELSIRAHYSTSNDEFLKMLLPEKITHFVFDRAAFSKRRLKSATFNKPFDLLVRELTSQERSFFVHQLPVDNKIVVPFIDDRAILVDLKELAKIKIN